MTVIVEMMKNIFYKTPNEIPSPLDDPTKMPTAVTGGGNDAFDAKLTKVIILDKTPASLLQEIFVLKKGILPKYELVQSTTSYLDTFGKLKVTGPVFKYCVKVGKLEVTGEDKSKKKEAKQNAAKAMLEKLNFFDLELSSPHLTKSDAKFAKFLKDLDGKIMSPHNDAADDVDDVNGNLVGK